MRAKTLAWLLALSTAAFAGCGGDDEQSTSSGSQASSTPSGTMTVWHYYDEGAGGLFTKLPEWKRVVETKFPDVTLNFQYVPYDQMTSKVTAAAAAGKGPDIVMPTAPFMPEMIRAGALAPIDEMWNGFADKAQFPEQIVESLKFEGRQYGTQAFANVEGLFYNTKILDEIGAEPPEDLDQLEAAMADAKRAGYTPMTLDAPGGAGGEFTLVPLMASAGWSYEDPTNAGGLDAVRRVGTWVERGFINKSDSGGFNSATNFSTGKYAFAIAGNWNLPTFKKALGSDYGVATPEGLDRALIGGETLAVGANAKDPAAAWAIIQEMLLTREAAQSIAEAGSVPLRKDVAEEAARAADPLLSEFSGIAERSIALPLLKESGKVSDAIGGAFNELVAGKISGDEAADRIAEEVPPLVQER